MIARSGGRSANELLEDQPGSPELTSLSASGFLSSDHVFISDSEKILRTAADTRFTIDVTRSRLTVRFNPGLVITNIIPYFFDVDVVVNSIFWDFASQDIGAHTTARGGVYVLSYLSSGESPGAALLGTLNGAALQ